MPKIKTRQSVAKRVAFSKTGKIMTRHAYTGHLKARKSNSEKRRLAIPGQVSRGETKSVKRAVPYKNG